MNDARAICNTNPSYGVEFSIHACPKTLKRELRNIFPGLESCDHLFVIPTFQKANIELLDFSHNPAVEAEKDRLLNNFIAFAKHFKQAVQEQQPAAVRFADFTEPSSGLPFFSPRGGSTYADVDGAELLLKYKTEEISGCRILFHPTFGSACYPATIFISNTDDSSNRDAILRILQSITKS